MPVLMFVVVVAMVVVAMVVGCAARVLPTYPIGTIRSVLALPYRHVLFDAINEEATGTKSLAPVRGSGNTHDRSIADFQLSDSVKRGEADPGDFLCDTLGDLRHLLLGHAFVSVVLKQRDGFSIAVIAHRPDENGDAADFIRLHGGESFVQAERLATYGKQAHASDSCVKVPERPPDFSKRRVGPSSILRSIDFNMS